MKFVIIFLSFILLFSCRKDPDFGIQTPTEVELNSFDLVKTEGSWWKYDWYSIDSLGNETLTAEKDCVYVVGDTLINGNYYTHYRGDVHILNSVSWFWRDSLNYIVNEKGKKQFSTTEKLDTLEVLSNVQETKYIITNGIQSEYTVPAGTFSVYDRQIHYTNTDGSPYTSCEQSWIKHTRLANGIGIISTQTGYVSQIQQGCSYDESRLTAYFIAE